MAPAEDLHAQHGRRHRARRQANGGHGAQKKRAGNNDAQGDGQKTKRTRKDSVSNGDTMPRTTITEERNRIGQQENDASTEEVQPATAVTAKEAEVTAHNLDKAVVNSFRAHQVSMGSILGPNDMVSLASDRVKKTWFRRYKFYERGAFMEEKLMQFLARELETNQQVIKLNWCKLRVKITEVIRTRWSTCKMAVEKIFGGKQCHFEAYCVEFNNLHCSQLCLIFLQDLLEKSSNDVNAEKIYVPYDQKHFAKFGEINQDETPSEKKKKAEEDKKILLWLAFHFLPAMVSRTVYNNNAKTRCNILKWTHPSDLAFLVLLLENYYTKWKALALHRQEHNGEEMPKEDRQKLVAKWDGQNGLSNKAAKQRYRKLFMYISGSYVKNKEAITQLNSDFWQYYQNNVESENIDDPDGADQTSALNETVLKHRAEEEYYRTVEDIDALLVAV